MTVFETTGRVLAHREREAVAAALRESEERHRALVTASSYATYSMSPDWTELRRLDGRGFLTDTERPTGSWPDTYIPPEDRPGGWAAIADAIRNKSVFDLEHRVRRADSTLGWTHSRAVPLLEADGTVREWFGAATHVTERKRTEAALREPRWQQTQTQQAARRLPFECRNSPHFPAFARLA
ncbi:hypothetical protein D9599_24650 [Roseomonas sp. KE2513]|uniref:PAS domain-containing protein n=1 Tax=Roseomonas sp. KE2513 TaxID=2479202 RepID=UPI0018DF5717|nr:PAS domain-containing protein [Roseomonas sp. KE2513]MBI0538751.1 hypothetical protein [Roseomonas sp. KE2513]